MPFTDLTNPPTAPNRSMTNDEFIDAADAFVAWWVQFAGTDLPTFINELEATAALIAAAPAVADPYLTAVAGLTPNTDQITYATSTSTAALATLTSVARTLIAQTTQANMRTTGLGMSANGSSLVSAADYAAMRTLLSVYTQAQVDSAVAAAVASAKVNPGIIAEFGNETPPSGWLECDGTAKSRTTYADLFAAIGTKWGAGDGSTTFNLPDFRGEFRRGWDHGRGIDSGRAFASFQADELKAHTHTIASGFGSTQMESGGGGTANSFDTGSTGGTETRPRNIATLVCIKT